MVSDFLQIIIENPVLQALAILLGIAAPIFGLVAWIIKSAKERRSKPVNIKGSQDEFKIINKKFGGLNRTYVSKLAHKINLDYLNDENLLPSEELPLLSFDKWIPKTPIKLENVTSSLIDEV